MPKQKMDNGRNVGLRLDEETHRALVLIARSKTDASKRTVTPSDIVRDAIHEFLTSMGAIKAQAEHC